MAVQTYAKFCCTMVLTSTMTAHHSSTVALIGTCGTCAVKVEGEVSGANWRDNNARRSLPPHSPTSNLR